MHGRLSNGDWKYPNGCDSQPDDLKNKTRDKLIEALVHLYCVQAAQRQTNSHKTGMHRDLGLPIIRGAYFVAGIRQRTL